MKSLNTERVELREFSASVKADATRSLVLLRDIESTLIWLERLTGQLRTDAKFADKVNLGLDLVSGIIDPDDDIQNGLQLAQNEVEDLYRVLIEKRQHGRDDTRLTEDDGIEDAYTEAIACAADLHNAINTLRWNIGEHDVDYSPRILGKTYTADNIDQMFDDLLAQ